LAAPHCCFHSYSTRRSSDLRRSVIRRPIPCAAPVTTATRSPFVLFMFPLHQPSVVMASYPGSPAVDTWPVVEDGERVAVVTGARSEEHTSELQSRFELVCRI